MKLTLGHVHLKVNDLKIAEAFYTKLLGFKVQQKVKNDFVFLTLGKHHHDLALMNIGKDAPHPNEWMTGLYHFALELKNKAEFKKFYKKLKNKVTLYPINHGISLAMYFNDPDNNTVELYVDTRKTIKQWNGNQILSEKEINSF